MDVYIQRRCGAHGRSVRTKVSQSLLEDLAPSVSTWGAATLQREGALGDVCVTRILGMRGSKSIYQDHRLTGLGEIK